MSLSFPTALTLMSHLAPSEDLGYCETDYAQVAAAVESSSGAKDTPTRRLPFLSVVLWLISSPTDVAFSFFLSVSSSFFPLLSPVRPRRSRPSSLTSWTAWCPRAKETRRTGSSLTACESPRKSRRSWKEVAGDFLFFLFSLSCLKNCRSRSLTSRQAESKEVKR